jgi:CRP-like cAMP-binding protein
MSVDFLIYGMELKVPAGTLLYQDGGVYGEDEVMVGYIIDGEIAVDRKDGSAKYLDMVYKTDEVVAADVVYNGCKSLTNAVAVTDTNLYVWPRAQFENLVGMNIEFAVKAISQLSKRLRSLNHKLSGMLTRESTSNSPQAYFDQGLESFNKQTYPEAKANFERFIEENPDHALVPRTLVFLGMLKKLLQVNVEQGPSLERVSDEEIDQDAKVQYGLYQLAFKGLGGLMEKELAKYLRVYENGDVLFREGDEGDELFMIVSGKLRVTKVIDGQKRNLAVLSEGDLVGEMAIFENKPRSATVEAIGKAEVLAFNRGNFKMVFQLHPQWTIQLIESFAGRINAVYHEIGKANYLMQVIN